MIQPLWEIVSHSTQDSSPLTESYWTQNISIVCTKKPCDRLIRRHRLPLSVGMNTVAVTRPCKHQRDGKGILFTALPTETRQLRWRGPIPEEAHSAAICPVK